MHVHSPGYPNSAFIGFGDHGSSDLALLFAIIAMRAVGYDIDVPPLPITVIEIQRILKEYSNSQRVVEWGSFGETKDIPVCMSEEKEDLVEKLAEIQNSIR